jgi:hypothetical protein
LDFGLAILDRRFWTGDFGLAILDWRFWTGDFGFRIKQAGRNIHPIQMRKSKIENPEFSSE